MQRINSFIETITRFVVISIITTKKHRFKLKPRMNASATILRTQQRMETYTFGGQCIYICDVNSQLQNRPKIYIVNPSRRTCTQFNDFKLYKVDEVF